MTIDDVREHLEKISTTARLVATLKRLRSDMIDASVNSGKYYDSINKKLTEELTQYYLMIDVVLTDILRIKNHFYSNILLMRYIMGFKDSELIDKLNYSHRAVYYNLKKALVSLTELTPAWSFNKVVRND
jgi:hypothetical protein